ncbi:hypothetical protein Mpet_1432 [Methanolacinia petrolearia DSM 11571]|uniref:Uncharacterized protein n=1 Tax=Methanolacinia petrolearia (strain DSM 11571 / OCM 486 / SEBR 4847) TaxID=679926 RepID=E1RFG1_METP4|nr:hypothetical protein [Methanolacinia petrolearia]ADN36191.1 hypothetical protein Mpet_1432 [Methanolacinia petrolearia DSM 11571]
MIELVGYTNKITGEFLVILALLGLVSFFIAYIYVKFTEKRNLENYYFYIFGTGFLLVVITQLMVSLRSISPLLIGLGFVTYFPGIFIAFVLPGLFIKKQFPEKYSAFLVSVPALFIPYNFFNHQGLAGDMENSVNIMYEFEFVFDYIGAVILSGIILGFILLAAFTFKGQETGTNIFLPASVVLLIIMTFFSSLITGAIFLSVYLYVFIKEAGIKTGRRNIFFLSCAAFGLLVVLPVLMDAGMGGVNTCIYSLFGTLAVSLAILGLFYFLDIIRDTPGMPE